MFARKSGRYLVPAGLVLAASVAVAWFASVAWAIVAVLAVVFLFMLWFFRDPERDVGTDVVSPADGKVLHADDGPRPKLTIFMTPFDVHVNRAPMEGRITSMEYHRGSHVPAFKKESDRNERLEVNLATAQGPVLVRLIAGTVARRIHPYLTAGAEVKKGDRIGLIAFGSRCELVLPPGKYRFLARPGDWVKAGKTPVAKEVV